MNSIHLQLNKKVAALSAEHPFEHVLLRYLFVAAGLLAFVYLYLVAASVLNVIAQKEADQNSSALESKIGGLEAQYFSLSQDITQQKASELGLLPVSESSFVYRLSTVGLNSSAQNAI